MPWPPGDPDFKDYAAKVEKYPFDLQKAAQMFATVGYAKQADGFLHSLTTGARLEPLEFRTTGEQSFQVAILAAMSDMLKQAGLDINQVVIPQERTSDRQYRVTNPGLEVLQFATGANSLLNQGAMTTSKLPTAANGFINGNYPRYSNPEWDALIDKFAVTIVPTQRKQVITDLMAHIADNLPDMAIIWGVSTQFAAKRLVVPEVNPIWTAEQWDLRS
jgi:ABC-type transport system substrate-binding protein